jgi:hypothetical protein
MSEYQYYEWQTIDRPLSPNEREAVARLSQPHGDSVAPGCITNPRGVLIGI